MIKKIDRYLPRMGNCRSKKRRNDVNMAGDGLNQASSNINRRRLRLGGGGGYGDIGNLDYANFMSGQGYDVIFHERDKSLKHIITTFICNMYVLINS